MSNLKVFKNQYLLNLELSVGDNLDHYRSVDSSFFNGDGTGVFETTCVVPDEVPILIPNISSESENAIHLFEYLSQIDNTVASDPRLWAYLVHVTFCDYAMKRWGSVEKDELKKRVLNRFFTDGDARTLRRQAISRLWWATKLTVAPWEDDPFFEPFRKDDRYYYTRVLMRDETTSSDLLERVQLASRPQLLILILDFLDNNPRFRKRVLWREFMKEIILTLGYRKIMALDLKALQSEISDIAFEVEKRYSNEKKQDKTEEIGGNDYS
ncbi:hypothetical protein IJI89_00180 [Candidatus Saccharibacteria bacterium]|nr:hypothetical protein [Candidatus Saccharibacteria bacterium]